MREAYIGITKYRSQNKLIITAITLQNITFDLISDN